jgi:hypothetical protein
MKVLMSLKYEDQMVLCEIEALMLREHGAFAVA